MFFFPIVIVIELLSRVRLFCDPVDCSPQAPLSMGFPIGLIISSSMLIHIINLQKGGSVHSDSLNLFAWKRIFSVRNLIWEILSLGTRMGWFER